MLTVDGPPERTRLDTLELWEGGPRRKGTMVARVAVLGRSLDEAADALLGEMRA
jgi:hypothetical protein